MEKSSVKWRFMFGWLYSIICENYGKNQQMFYRQFLQDSRRFNFSLICLRVMVYIFTLLSCFWSVQAETSPLNPYQTIVVLPKDVKWTSSSNNPKSSVEMATLYGDLNKPGPYCILVKWYPGYMSAPHSYATDRLSTVVSGAWCVNSGKDFDPNHCIEVPAGVFVKRVAHTPHYDGVKKDAKEPAIIAIFGIGPVDFKLVDSTKPSWRKI